MALLFFDLSILPSPTSNPSSPNSRLLAAARAFELGYAGVALDHQHRGLLADSDRCRLAPFPALSSLPLPSSVALHRRRNGSPDTEPFRQYTRITLSLDSAAAAASALAPSAARLLRTYDVVAARPLNQATLDHLCQVATEVDIISIDFSHKLPFRLKLPMLKLALQRGLHFEIAYSPLIDDVNSRRQVLAEAKLLVDWTKGKNIIISSAGHSANEIRGPYDVINLCSYLLGFSTQRAKAAMSINCRSLITKALRKKHFYKETIRIDRLLPNEQLSSTKYKVGDWIGWDPVNFEGDVQSSETHLSSSNRDVPPGPPINSSAKVSHEKPRDADVSLFAERLDQPTDDKEISAEIQEGTVQAKRDECLMDFGLSTLSTSPHNATLLASYGHHNVAKDTISDKPGNNKIVVDLNVQAVATSCVDQKCIDEHVDLVQDAMELDAPESFTSNLISGDSVPLSSDVKLACSSLPQVMELCDTSLENMCPEQSSDILDCSKGYAKYDTGCTSGEREDRAPVDHEIPSGSDVCLEDKGLGKPEDIPVDSDARRDTESLGCPSAGRDDEAPFCRTVQLTTESCKDIVPLEPAMEDKIEQHMNGNIEQITSDTVELVGRDATGMSSVEHISHDQDICSTVSVDDKGSSDIASENDEFKEQKSMETNDFLEKDVIKVHRHPLNHSYASDKVLSTATSEKRRQKLRLCRPTYLPFLGFLKPVLFKKKVSSKRKS